MGANSKRPTQDSESDKLGILIPVIAENEEPSKNWGFTISRTIIGE